LKTGGPGRKTTASDSQEHAKGLEEALVHDELGSFDAKIELVCRSTLSLEPYRKEELPQVRLKQCRSLVQDCWLLGHCTTANNSWEVRTALRICHLAGPNHNIDRGRTFHQRCCQRPLCSPYATERCVGGDVGVTAEANVMWEEMYKDNLQRQRR
jgi:hypothetical protein